MDRNEEGSIVISASMSAQIINQAGRNTPLTQVSVVVWKYDVLLNLARVTGILQLVQGRGSYPRTRTCCRVGRETYSSEHRLSRLWYVSRDVSCLYLA